MSDPRPLFLVSRVPRAELRVYLPIGSGTRHPRARAADRPGWWDLERLIDEAGRGDSDRLVLVRGKQTFVCPRRIAWTVAQDIVASREHLSPYLFDAVVPPSAAHRLSEYMRWLTARHPGWREHVKVAPWSVPPEWFVAFDESERRYEVDAGGGPHLSYTTEAGAARQRLTDAVRVVTDADLGDGPAIEMRELVEWLERFPPDGLLELDYHTLVRLFGPEQLADDHSVRIAREALDALAKGDVMRSGVAYVSLMQVWAPLRDRAHAS